VKVTTTAANQIDAWSATTTFEGADQDSADNLAIVMESIRWEGAPNPITIEVEGLAPGAPYEVQLLTNEGRGPTRYRVWDIMVEEELVADNISSIGRLNEDEWDETNSAAYRGVFTATAGGTLSIAMAQDLGGDPPGGEDNNPILNAIVIHAANTPDPLADGLVGYWPLDGDANDTVGDYHGEAMGSEPLTYDAGKLGGGGVDLDGVDQFIQISGDENVFDFGAPDEPTGFTISAWYRVDAFTKSWQCLVAKGEGNRWRVHRRGADEPPVFAANGGNADVPAYDGTAYPIADGNYHHVVVVSVPDDRVELWLDGDLVSTGPAPVLEDGANPMAIGENPDALGRTWDGGVDDVAAWNRPLSGEEVERLYAEGQAGSSLGDLIGGGSDNDRDKDGLPNLYEEANGLNPDDPADAALDGDGDGLTNLQEYERRTDITKADTDGDGLSDKVETKTLIWVSAEDTGTDPRKPDTDGDGLLDGVETNTKTFVNASNTGTDPHNRDTDGDRATDGVEVASGTNPLVFDERRPPVLVAHYEFEDPDDLGHDSSGMENHAEVSEVVQVEGNTDAGFGQGAFFDESLASSFVQTGGLSGFTGKPGVTLAAWVKLDENTTGYDGIISQDPGGCCQNRILLEPGHNVFINLSEHSDRNLSGGPPVDFDVWTHIAMTGLDLDGESEARVYINGVEVDDSPQIFPEMDDGSEWNTYLGAGESGTAHLLTGALDDVRIYEGALTAEEILELLKPLTPAATFQITQIATSPTEVTMTWQSRPGREYSVEYNENLSNDTWIELDDGVQSEGEETTFSDDDPERTGKPVGWYRIRDNG
jgi:hypothetical protein